MQFWESGVQGGWDILSNLMIDNRSEAVNWLQTCKFVNVCACLNVILASMLIVFS